MRLDSCSFFNDCLFDFPVLKLDNGVVVRVHLRPLVAVVDVGLDVGGSSVMSYKFKKKIRCQFNIRFRLFYVFWEIWSNYESTLDAMLGGGEDDDFEGFG